MMFWGDLQKMDSFKGKLSAGLASARSQMEEARTKGMTKLVEEKVASSGLSEGVAKLKEKAALELEKVSEKKAALSNSLHMLGSSLPKGLTRVELAEPEIGSEAPSSDGESPTCDRDRLLSDSDPRSPFRSGLGKLGSFTENLGVSKLVELKSVAQAKVSGSLEKVRDLGLEKAQKARDLASNGVEKVQAAGQKARDLGSSGVEKLKTTAATAKERCGEAAAAASMMTGVNLGGLGAAKEEQDSGLVRVCKCCPALSLKQRIIGAFTCLAIGCLLSLGSLMSIAKLLMGNPIPFAFKYTLGNLLSLGATSFLVGPTRQLKQMMEPSRRLASLTYFGTLIGTLVCIFVLHSGLLSLVFIILQFFALTWYILSYIPYGQTAAIAILRRLLRRAGLSGKSSSAHSANPMSPV